MQPLPQLLLGFSKALYSTWFLYKPDSLLFDAGEGAASTIGRRLSAIKYIFLSHGHCDHISGLSALIHVRSREVRDPERPLTIYYPEGDSLIELAKNYIVASHFNLVFPLNWIPLKAGESVTLSGNKNSQHSRQILPFATEHQPGLLTLAYHLLERRWRLMPEYQGLSKAQMQDLVRQKNRDEFMEQYHQKLVTYVGDTVPLNEQQYTDSELLMHEATHLERGIGHSTLDEILSLASRVKPKQLLLYHFSPRHSRQEIIANVRKGCCQYDIDFPVWIQYRHWLVKNE